MKNNTIETENLILRPFNMEDVSDVFILSQEESIHKWIPDQVYKDKHETKEVLNFLLAQYKEIPTPNESPYVIGIVLKETKELIGHIGLSPIEEDVEIGYAIGENSQGNGYATEAIKSITSWAFKNLRVSKILGIVDSNNKASWKALEKSDFDFVDESKREAFGRDTLCRVYQKLK
ncbi:MAG: GNAT family N-acetyltransferase [Firmicutes bacterium]|nr:GNAT family N-acetyltransferase [Bacillota bacterium]